MSYFIVIREYKQTDFHNVFEVVRTAYLSNVFTTWCNALTREITFQLIVMCAAVLFIFVGVPLLYCLIAIPIVLGVIYTVIYSSYLMKSAELMHSKKPLQCWVAEVCEPFLCILEPKNVHYKIITDMKNCKEGVDMGDYRRRIIGTVAVSRHLHFEKSVWLHRLAVLKSYRHKQVGHALVQVAQDWCRQENYTTLEVGMSECQESARQLFVNMGFEIRQLYHQPLIGSAFTLLMYQLSCDLSNVKQKL